MTCEYRVFVRMEWYYLVPFHNGYRTHTVQVLKTEIVLLIYALRVCVFDHNLVVAHTHAAPLASRRWKNPEEETRYFQGRPFHPLGFDWGFVCVALLLFVLHASLELSSF